MKLASLKIVTTEPTTQNPVPATIADVLPPPIHAVAQRPVPRRTVRRLNVDEVLARSVPKTSVESLPLHGEQVSREL